MKFFVTGVAGQLGHDVMNELAKEDTKESEAISHRSTAALRMAAVLPPCLTLGWILQMQRLSERRFFL